MLEVDTGPEPSSNALDAAFREAPRGAFLIAGLACAVVFGLWLLFYLLVFLPRGVLQ